MWCWKDFLSAKFIVEVLCPDDESLQLLSILFAIVLLSLPPERSFAGVCVNKLTMSRLQNIESFLIIVSRLTSYFEVYSKCVSGALRNQHSPSRSRHSGE